MTSAASASLSSPTLAMLYLAQGHPTRARAIVSELLAADPHHPGAWALSERIAVRDLARLDLALVERTLHVTWRGARGPCALVLAYFAPDDASRGITRHDEVLPIHARAGTQTAAVGPLAGAAVACLIASRSRVGASADGARVLAVARPQSWPREC